jgi:hypothetical protein
MKSQKQLDMSPESTQDYTVDTYRIAGSTDNADDAARLGRDLAETLERVMAVDGSSIAYGDGRWKGSTEFGFTVTIAFPVGHCPKFALLSWMQRTAATLYVTKSTEVAFEVF